MPVKREIIYPFFLECCTYAPDSFWSSIFEDLAYGKCPYGTYISKDFLCCSQKKKEFSYKIEYKDPEKLYKDVYHLLSEKLGLLSKKDQNAKKNILLTTKEPEDWVDIKKKNIKDMYLEKFVVDMKNKHSLTLKQARYLLSIIIIATAFKILTPKDIVFYDGEVKEITGIDFEDGEIILSEELLNMDNTTNTVVIDETSTMSSTWPKYLKDLRKYVK